MGRAKLTPQKCSEMKRAPDGLAVGIHTVHVLIPPYIPREMAADSDENRHRCHLARQPGDHDIDSHLVIVVRVRRARDSAANGLQEQRYKIAQYENTRYCPRFEEAQTAAVYGDDASKAEVDGCGEECGADGQADEVDDE